MRHAETLMTDGDHRRLRSLVAQLAPKDQENIAALRQRLGGISERGSRVEPKRVGYASAGNRDAWQARWPDHPMAKRGQRATPANSISPVPARGGWGHESLGTHRNGKRGCG